MRFAAIIVTILVVAVTQTIAQPVMKRSSVYVYHHNILQSHLNEGLPLKPRCAPGTRT